MPTTRADVDDLIKRWKKTNIDYNFLPNADHGLGCATEDCSNELLQKRICSKLLLFSHRNF